ncbi:MAG TPA: VOC family protein [Chloroflexota bacterium]|nr:VOC family protein [Chloroflexota bacterium]
MDGVSTIDHTGFIAENLVRAEKFYEKVFGAQVLFRTHLSTADRKKGYVPFTAVAVPSPEAYARVYKAIPEYGGFDEGDHRAALRAPGEQSTYFYDPATNRLQLIIVES